MKQGSGSWVSFLPRSLDPDRRPRLCRSATTGSDAFTFQDAIDNPPRATAVGTRTARSALPLRGSASRCQHMCQGSRMRPCGSPTKAPASPSVLGARGRCARSRRGCARDPCPRTRKSATCAMPRRSTGSSTAHERVTGASTSSSTIRAGSSWPTMRPRGSRRGESTSWLPCARVRESRRGWVRRVAASSFTSRRLPAWRPRAFLEVVATGTHAAEWRGIPATGKTVRFPVCAIFTFGPDDKINAEIAYYDRLTVLSQLGVA